MVGYDPTQTDLTNLVRRSGRPDEFDFHWRMNIVLREIVGR
jgi:hypothetical protein